MKNIQSNFFVGFETRSGKLKFYGNFSVLACFLILGAFITFVSAQRDTFEFTDSNGQCWRCR